MFGIGITLGVIAQSILKEVAPGIFPKAIIKAGYAVNTALAGSVELTLAPTTALLDAAWGWTPGADFVVPADVTLARISWMIYDVGKASTHHYIRVMKNGVMLNSMLVNNQFRTGAGHFITEEVEAGDILRFIFFRQRNINLLAAQTNITIMGY